MISMVTLTTGRQTNQHPAFIVRRPVWSGNTLTTQRRSQGSAEVKSLPGLSMTQELLFFVGFGQVQYTELVMKTKIFESRIK